jgi:salicylate hydroxylase
MRQLLVAGGGIGGLAAALAAARAGWQVQVFEQASEIAEVGAGVQLGPNATRRLRQWGLLDAVQAQACAPTHLVSRSALDGSQLARLPLGERAQARYGSPYLTAHRADLQAVLVQALKGQPVVLHTGARVLGAVGETLSPSESFAGVAGVAVRWTPWAHPHAPRVRAADAASSPDASTEGAVAVATGDALVGADGLWSAVRAGLLADGPARPSNHVAYRGLLPMDLAVMAGPAGGGSASARAPWCQEVTAWLGPRLHVVTYPVRGGRALNVVCVVQQSVTGPTQGWDLTGTREDLMAATEGVSGILRELLLAVPVWGRWVLHDRPVLAGPQQMARGPVALLGDAAHPMRPYLAQGAAMALEDAHALGQALNQVSDHILDVPQAMQRYALARWERARRVQRRSLRNGQIFHAAGPMRLARDLALRIAGPQLMDLPWLYAG